MATTRLRRTFKYPSDSDSDDPPDLDEEHQETLLATLQAQDEATNTRYRHAFLFLPLITALAYTPSLLTATNATQIFLAFLSITAPGIGAYVLYFHPIRLPGKHGLRSLYVSSGRSEEAGGVKPYERHLIVLGASLAGMLLLQSVAKWFEGDGEDVAWVALPGGECF